MEKEISDNMLDIDETVYYNDRITSYTYQEINVKSKANIDNDNTQLTFNIEATDNYYVPSNSYILISGRLQQMDDNPFIAADEITLINNTMMYLFKSIEYRIGNETMELLRCPGQTTSWLEYLSFPDD